MKNVFLYAIVTAALIFGTAAHAWTGTDSESGSSVEIEKGNLVRSSNDIEVYDYDTSQYRYVTVESITRYGSTVEIEVTDTETGETTTLEMDDN